MIFTAPLVLLGVAVLPVLYLLFRLTPPAAKRVMFPPLALLRGLPVHQRTPQHMPLWLLLLRLAAALLMILGLAGPIWHPPAAIPGSGPILLVIDNGWASAADWPTRQAAAQRLIAAAKLQNRGIAILATAPKPGNQTAGLPDVLNATQAAQAISNLAPQPWPTSRQALVSLLQSAPESSRVYIADGITGPGFAAFLAALHPQAILGTTTLPALLLAPTISSSGELIIHLATPSTGRVLAQSATGTVIASAELANTDHATLDIPLSLRNQITKLSLGNAAGSVFYLDDSNRSLRIGLNAGSQAAETPYLGAWFFARRALPAGSSINSAPLASLLTAKTDAILLADVPLSAPQQAETTAWINQGGVLIRFAGPLTAATPDALQPSPLRPGITISNGTLTGGPPPTLATFPANSPFAGLTASDVTVARQILPDPAALTADHVWASLTDGTPLVLGRAIGKGFLVSVLTTANTDWSSLALSGSYPDLLTRLVRLGHGSASQPAATLPAWQQLTAFGSLAPATRNASLSPAALAGITIAPAQPAGLYGTGENFTALNLGGHVPTPQAANLPGALPLTGPPPPVSLGGDLLRAALLLLLFDLALSLRLRGLLVVLVLAAGSAHAQQTAALTATLAYVKTGDQSTDKLSAEGLFALAALVAPPRTAAQLGPPVGVVPGKDSLGLYPLLYWPILPTAAAPAAAVCTALGDYMAHGGLLIIDTQGSDEAAPGSGAGFAPGATAALNRSIACLNLPPLVPLTTADPLAHSFYILKNFAGRFTGAPVLVAAPAARDSGQVTAIIIGQNDWAGAWARDTNNAPEQTPIPGGELQRIDADRFGVNLIFYALMGNYDAYQTNLPALLNQAGTAP
ncbi:MAG: DUF4159 domain-containing protein [Acidocella sp.]|nr:DUF4159 domain-containing protein [Acidocella sp.]